MNKCLYSNGREDLKEIFRPERRFASTEKSVQKIRPDKTHFTPKGRVSR